MKKICLLLISICFVYAACKKTEDGPGELYGKWKLTESYVDPGDGSGKYTKVKGEPKYLIFERSGKISGDALSDLYSFKIIDSLTIEVYSNTYKMPLTYRYKVSARALTLNPPCIEGCGMRFIRE